jgi:xylitol oxidase
MMEAFDARPHWGKEFYNVDRIRRQYAGRLAEFEQVRSRFDPQGTFLNPTVREVLGG